MMSSLASRRGRRCLLGTTVVAIAATAFFLHGCTVPSLRNLDIPPASGKSTLTLLPSMVNMKTGESTIFTATGGKAPYTFAVEPGEPEGGSLVPDTTTVRYTAPGAAGTYILAVTDADENLTEATAIVTDAIPLSVSPAIITVTVGTTVTLVASGGNGTYSFVLLSGGGTLIQLTGLDANKATYRSLSSETAQIEVDSGLTESVSAVITSTTPTGGLEISPSSLSLTTGQKLTFTAYGGTAPYSYSAETSTGSIDADTGLFTAADVKKLGGKVRVTDSVGGTSDATVDVYYPLTIVPTDVYVMTGGTYTFTASGGIDTYHYFVTSGIDTGTIDELSGVYTAPGSACSPKVQVRDDLGNTSYATVHVFVPTWYIHSVDTELKSGQYASLALDAGNNPHVAYYESQGKELRLASWDGAAWSSQVVDGTTGSVGLYASLALDPTTSDPRISYYDADPRNRDLRYAVYNGSSWSWEVVDDVGTVGLYTSLALDPTTGYPRISYYDATPSKRDLKYASWNGTEWEVTVVDEAGDVGKHSSLALDPTNGRPCIAYYDATLKQLKYAEWNGSAWLFAFPDPGTDRGEYCSLALDASGNPHISHYDTTLGDLRYAWNDGIWHAVIVDSSNDRGQYSSIALDAGGLPRISYYDSTQKRLMFASFDGSPPWTIDGGIDPAPNGGMYTSLRLANSGKAVIAYYGSSAQDLKVAVQP